MATIYLNVLYTRYVMVCKGHVIKSSIHTSTTPRLSLQYRLALWIASLELEDQGIASYLMITIQVLMLLFLVRNLLVVTWDLLTDSVRGRPSCLLVDWCLLLLVIIIVLQHWVQIIQVWILYYFATSQMPLIAWATSKYLSLCAILYSMKDVDPVSLSPFHQQERWLPLFDSRHSAFCFC